MHCPQCGHERTVKRNGKKGNKQLWMCVDCPAKDPGRSTFFETELHREEEGEGRAPAASGRFSESDLREKHDMMFRLKKFLQALPRGEFIEEVELLKELCMFRKPGYKQAVEHPDIKPHRGKADGTIYYGHPDSIRTLKQEGVLM
jgi:ssDNA-binding Zn-finger/Zn-ribbon topoisomerase 1